MHDPRLMLLKISSWWSRPKVWPTSWHITRFLQAGVLYVAVLKYVSLTLVVPAVSASAQTSARLRDCAAGRNGLARPRARQDESQVDQAARRSSSRQPARE